MALLDVREVFVVQDRASGAFIDINMSFVSSLKYAVRVDTRQLANESMHCAILDDVLECPEGWEIHSIYELND